MPSLNKRWRRSICTGAALSAMVAAAGCSSNDIKSTETVGSVSQAVQTTSTVLVNQLGYGPGAQKIAVVLNTSSTAGTVQVVNSGGTVIWTGGSTIVKNADVNSGDKVHLADFTGFATVGSGYKVKVTIGGTAYTSEPFDIGTSLYNPSSGLSLTKGAMKYFYWKRDGSYTVAADTTYNVAGHGASHTGDGAMLARMDSATSARWSTVTFDVKGGHLDAGDFSKYVESDTAKAFYLANMFERTKGVADPNAVKIETLDLGFNDGALPDVLAEIAWGARWVRGILPEPTVHKTAPLFKDLAGNKAAGDAWALWVNIDADTATDRYVNGPSTSATYSISRTLAHVSRLLRPYGTAATIVDLDGTANLSATAYADKLWATAKEAFGRASGKHPDYADYTGAGTTAQASDIKVSQTNGFNNGSGFYGDNDTTDDRHAAEVEMYLSACQKGETAAIAKYKALVTANPLYKQAGPCDWGSEIPLGDAAGEERGCALLSLLTSAETLCTGANALPAADITTMKNNLYAYADGLVANMNGQNYPFYSADGSLVPWGSNAAQASAVVMLTVAYEKSGNKNYLKNANRAMDYLLGVNPMKMSYVIGFGEAAETVTHDRAMKATGKYVKGTMVGGPHNVDANFGALSTFWGGGPAIDDGGTTPNSGPVLKHMAVTTDPSNSWESQENAVNWNAALANATWGLAIHNDEMTCTVAAECDDGNLCTTDSCSSGICSNVATSCDDGRACTADSCNPSTGACVNNAAACCANNAACSDGTSCSSDVCGANELCTNPSRNVCCLTTAALARTAVASSSDENTTNAAANAIDGNTTTRWASSFNDEQWLRIDLGSSKYVKRVVLNWEAAASAAYDIEVADSTTGPWKKIYSTIAGNGGIDDLGVANGLTPAAGRYVRMLGHTRTTPYGHSLYEMEVYGDAGTCLNYTVTCGDGSCDGTETASTCAVDCAGGGGSTCSCPDDGNPCTAEVCSGSTCTHPAGNSGVVCRASTGSCDAAESCNGTSTACPADGFVAAGTVCRASAGPCDAAESCSGSGASCPADAFAAAGTSCRAAANACDVAETCTGTANTCPTNAFAANGTVCNDANATTCGDACSSGVCGGIATPATPAAPAVSAGNAQVATSWSAVSGAANYTLKRTSGSATGTYANAATGITTTSYTNTGLTNGTAYFYKLAAVNSCGLSSADSAASAGATPSASCTPPAVPTGVGAAAGNAQATISWATVSGATSYTVLRSTTSGSGYTSVATGVTTTSYTNTGLTNGTTYYYVVQAVGACASGNSTQVSATPTAVTEPCTPNATFGAGVTNSGNFNTTGAYCFRTSYNIAGWGCSNFTGRTLQVNDVVKACGAMPMPTKYNGYYYFESSAGSVDYASIYWW